MAASENWKTLKPEEQLLALIRDVARLKEQLPTYTKIQGVKLEGRTVAGQRRLYAVIDDPTASNNGASYQIAP